MLLGLPDAPNTWQPTMNVIPSPVKWQFDLVYLDDIILSSLNAEKHISPIHTILLAFNPDRGPLKPYKLQVMAQADRLSWAYHIALQVGQGSSYNRHSRQLETLTDHTGVEIEISWLLQLIAAICPEL